MNAFDDKIIENGKIISTMLGIEDHGILTCMIRIDYGCGGQGFGGWALDEPIRDENDKFIKRVGSQIGMQFIRRILEVLEIDDWERLPGTPCRVEHTRSKVFRIGHYLNDEWFDPTELGFKI